MKQSLQLKLSQRLDLTPQLQQSIRLLQLSTLEFSQEMENYLLENPLLERDEEEYASPVNQILREANPEPEPEPVEKEAATPSESADDENWFGEEAFAKNSTNSFDDDDDKYQDLRVATTSLREHLLTQLGLMRLPARDHALVQSLIEMVDEDGYLRRSLEEIEETAPPELAIASEEWQIALKRLQFFDPIGVGARDTKECLLLQLNALPATNTKIVATKIVNAHLDLLARRDFLKLKKLVLCDEDALRDAQALICSLNPKPGGSYTASEAHYIVPDLVVKKVKGHWKATTNADTYPRLRVNQLYAQILSKQRGSGLADQLQEARWLIKNVQQRFETIQRVGQSIVDRQRRFFDYGDVAMRPLILREIAEELELHESTVSRVTTQKYMATPQGIFELKHFFGGSLETDAGGACSTTAIRAMVKQLIEAETRLKPLSDSRIAEVLGEQGFVVARRTVAKYRETLNIPAANRRKAF